MTADSLSSVIEENGRRIHAVPTPFKCDKGKKIL